MVEWAAWWDTTMERWKREGLPAGLSWEESLQYFGLDELHCITAAPAVPDPETHGGAVITDEADYERLRPALFSDAVIDGVKAHARSVKARHDAGDINIRLWLDGFFWFPRRLFGIEGHLFAFYDQPELMRRMNRDLCAFNLRVLEELFPIIKPDFVGLAEDMSYNLGPMLSHELFNEFLLPNYQQITAYTKSSNTRILVDSDGDVSRMIPWLLEAGLEGVYPLERQAGVDVNQIRHDYPDFIMLGGYDKMVMNKGEAAIRAEFERILPAMRQGRYIPSVDHQTPPGVSLEDYRIYSRLFQEYCEKAVS
jgi:hypothetical protein